MNWNSFSALLGIILLAFVVAFMVGRWSRPVRPVRSGDVQPKAATNPNFAAEAPNTSDSAADRLLTAVRAEAYEEEKAQPATPRPAPSTSVSNTGKPRPQTTTKTVQAKPAVQGTVATTKSKAAATPASATTDTATSAPAANERIVPKSVIAKDNIAIEERQSYASQLPKELLEKGVEAKVDVVGELAEVIIISSPSFDERSKDTVIKQVCIDLKSLGFKRVHITDGGSYTMHFGL